MTWKKTAILGGFFSSLGGDVVLKATGCPEKKEGLIALRTISPNRRKANEEISSCAVVLLFRNNGANAANIWTAFNPMPGRFRR